MKRLFGFYHYLRHALRAETAPETWQESLRRRVTVLSVEGPPGYTEEDVLFVARTFLLAARRALVVSEFKTPRVADVTKAVDEAYRVALGIAERVQIESVR